MLRILCVQLPCVLGKLHFGREVSFGNVERLTGRGENSFSRRKCLSTSQADEVRFYHRESRYECSCQHLCCLVWWDGYLLCDTSGVRRKCVVSDFAAGVVTKSGAQDLTCRHGGRLLLC